MANHEILNVPMTSELIRIEMEQTQGGAVDMFLKLDGIKGESGDHRHRTQSTSPRPVLMVIANQDFYYREYSQV